MTEPAWFSPVAESFTAREFDEFESTNVCRITALSYLLDEDPTLTIGLEEPLAELGFGATAIAARTVLARDPHDEIATAAVATTEPGGREYWWREVSESPTSTAAYAFLGAALGSALERESAAAAVVLARDLAPVGPWPQVRPFRLSSFREPFDWDGEVWRAAVEDANATRDRRDALLWLVDLRLDVALNSTDPVTRSLANALYLVDDSPPPADTPTVVEAPGTPDVSVLVHGTNAWAVGWWRPGAGTFHDYVLADVRRDLHQGGARFSWDGKLLDSHRSQAASDLVDWASELAPRGFHTVFAHSYGGDVAAKAKVAGLTVDELVLLSSPVTDTVARAATEVDKLVDVRLPFDPVLAAARLQQRVTQRVPPAANVIEILLPWSLDHGASHRPSVWREQAIAERSGLV